MSATSTESEVRLEASGSVAVVHLARRPVNAIHPDFIRQLDACFDEVERAGDFRSVLVASDLEVFAAGADIKMLDASGGVLDESFSAGIQRLFDRIELFPMPVVAAINGHALGGGLELALACDLRIAADRDAVQIGLPEVRIGLIPAAGGTQRLTRLLGKTRALDLLLTGRPLAPRDALEWGIVNEVVPPDRLLERARELAAEFADGPTQAYVAIKACAREAIHGSIERGLQVERDEARRLFDTADTREGLRAFVERRRPDFVGR